MIYVPGKGAIGAKILFVGDCPTADDEIALRPFSGGPGRFLNDLLSKAGIKEHACWFTNVSKYRVSPNEGTKKTPFAVRARNDGIDIDQQINELATEISQIKPNIVVPLGQTALWALTGKSPITSHRGSILQAFGFKCIPTYHPAHILYQMGDVKGYWNKSILEFDLKRIAVQAEFKEINLPHRVLQVAQNSADVYDFFKRYEGWKNPAIDIEAFKCIPCCIGISFTPNHGFTIPLWNHSGISNFSDNDLANAWILVATELAKHEVVGQNFGYDRDKLRRLGFTVKGLYSDTMLKAFCINPELPKNLGFLTSIYTEEPYYKDEGMYEGSMNDLMIGCARDACVTKEVEIKQQVDIDELGVNQFYREFILPLHELYNYNEDLDAIEQNGFAVNEKIRMDLLYKYIKWDETIRYELFRDTGDYVNTASPKQVSELLYDKLKLPLRKGTGEEVITSLLNNNVKDPTHARILSNILEDRRVKKTISSYLYSPTDYDGRMRTSYYLCLETGRSATQQQEPPIRPWATEKPYQARGMAFQTITKHGDIGSDIRTMLVADEGCMFIQADSSQAEARVIFNLAEDWQALKDIDEHDYHALTASWFFGGTEETWSKKVLGYECPERFGGKTLRHAGHLGQSKKGAAIAVNTQARKAKIAIKINESQADKALKIFHAKQPNIREVFHKGVIGNLTKSRRLVSPVPYGCSASIGGIRIFYERWGEDLFRQAFSYLPQRTVSENTKGAGLRIRRRAKDSGIPIRILVEAHDALLIQCRIEDKYKLAPIIREEFERPIDFSTCCLPRPKLVIPCELEEGFNYKELSKFKWLTLVA